jgi:TusA-related sulfurtransferase
MARFITLIFIAITFRAYSQVEKDQLLLYNGVYETKCIVEKGDDEGEQDYLRFYPNGKVINVGTDCGGTADDLMAWFHLNAEQVSVGDYSVNGKRIKFLIKDKSGTVKYTGRVNRSGILKLKWVSLINGSRGKSLYYFVNVNGLS